MVYDMNLPSLIFIFINQIIQQILIAFLCVKMAGSHDHHSGHVTDVGERWVRVGFFL